MKRLLLLLVAAVCAAVVVGAAHAPRADAAISCPSETIAQPVAAPGGGTVAVSAAATCNGAKWYTHIFLQYELSGSWHAASCVNSDPCDILRPSDVPDSFYAAGSHHAWNVTFDVLGFNGCSVRWRAQLAIGTPNPPNPKFVFTGPASHVC